MTSKNIKKPNKNHAHLDDEQINFDTIDFKNNENNDKQYESMLPKQKNNHKAMSYFKHADKYAGKVQHNKVQQKQQNFQQEQEDQQVQADFNHSQSQEQANQADGIKQALKQIKNKRKQRSSLLSQNLKKIQKQDNDNFIKMKQNQKQQGNPEALQNQLNQCNKLIQIRCYNQKNLQQLKRYPIRNYPVDQTLHKLHKKSQKCILSNLQQLISNYEMLSSQYIEQEQKISHMDQIIQKCEQQKYKNKRINVQSLWEKFQNQTKHISQKMEQQIISWSQRTALLRNSVNKSQYNSLLMQTPVGQAKKAIEDWEKVSKKCQQKRSPFRILFQPQQNILQMSNKNIYDDIDLLQEVQKNYEQQLQKEDKDFLIGDTMKYLENKSRNKISKQVDRKASKNRKIRYNVHPKLLNFMPCENDNLLEARDQIVKNLFNKGGIKGQQTVDYIDI